MTAPTGFKLRPYQERGASAVIEARRAGRKSVMLCLATGTGKTVTAGETVRRLGVGRDGRAVLWIAHQRELLDQGARMFKRVIPHAQIGWEMGDRESAPFDQIIFATVQSLRGHRGVALMERLQHRLFALVIDEAHRSAAASYRDLIKMAKNCEHATVLGLTATPNRSDKVTLADLFDEIAMSYDTREAIGDGYLVPPRGFRVATTTSLDGLAVSRGDYAEGELARRIDIDDRNRLVLRTWLDLANDKRTLVFCAGINHAESMARNFAASGISARAVAGDMGIMERAAIFAAFRTGEIQVLCGANLFVEGFDEPGVECVVFARPTRSSIYYQQALGRGLRPDEAVAMLLGAVEDRETRVRMISESAKPRALVIDFVDASAAGLMTLASLFGAKLAGEHEALREERAAAAAEQNADLEQNLAPTVGTREVEVRPGIVSVDVESFDILAAEAQISVETGKLAWDNSGGTAVRQLALPSQRVGILPDGSRSRKFDDAHHAASLNKERNALTRAQRAEPTATPAFLTVTMEVCPVGEDKWEAVEHSRIDKQAPQRRVVGSASTPKEALLIAERHVRSEHSRVVALVDREAPWRKLKPTPYQVAVFEKRGLPIPATRGEANDMMGHIITMRIIKDKELADSPTSRSPKRKKKKTAA